MTRTAANENKNPAWTYKQVIAQVLGTAETSSALVGKIDGGIVNAAAAVGGRSVRVGSRRQDRGEQGVRAERDEHDKRPRHLRQGD